MDKAAKKQRYSKRFWEITFLISALLVLIFSVFVVSPLADKAINSSFISRIDSSLADFVVPIRSDSLTNIFGFITQMGNTELVIIGTLFLFIVFTLTKNRKRIIPLSIVIVGTLISVYPAKIFVGRERPTDFIEAFIEDTFAFPSGHSAISIAFFGYLIYLIYKTRVGRHYKILWSCFIFILILLIGFSRIYLGVHYLSDVLAGFGIGLLWLLIGVSVSEYLILRNITPDSKDGELKNHRASDL